MYRLERRCHFLEPWEVGGRAQSRVKTRSFGISARADIWGIHTKTRVQVSPGLGWLPPNTRANSWCRNGPCGFWRCVSSKQGGFRSNFPPAASQTAAKMVEAHLLRWTLLSSIPGHRRNDADSSGSVEVSSQKITPIQPSIARESIVQTVISFQAQRGLISQQRLTWLRLIICFLHHFAVFPDSL